VATQKSVKSPRFCEFLHKHINRLRHLCRSEGSFTEGPSEDELWGILWGKLSENVGYRFRPSDVSANPTGNAEYYFLKKKHGLFRDMASRENIKELKFVYRGAQAPSCLTMASCTREKQCGQTCSWRSKSPQQSDSEKVLEQSGQATLGVE
jgi:hypothetical protein